tara:strand:+ start:61060 stop:64461 length:3402 start_codon:yes stop_codon:yes gene_type:complete
MKGFIVYPTYRIDDDKAVVYLFGRLENGESFLSMHDFKPYFYILTKHRKRAEKIKAASFKDSSFTNFLDEKMTKVTLNLPADVPKTKRLFLEENIACYEADIRFPYRFLIDHDIRGSLDLDGHYETGEHIDRVYKNPDFEPTDFFPKLKVLSFDIETDKDAGDLYSISLYDGSYKNVLLVKKKGKFKNAECFPSEKEVLERFQELVLELDPDVIVGWNVIDFDLDYLKKKFKEHKVPFLFGRVPWPCKLRISESFFRDSSADFPGRMVLDGIHLMKTSFIKLDDYKLNTAAKHILGDTKIFQGAGRHDEITEAYNKDPQKLVDYNLKDSILAYDVIFKSGSFDLTILRSLLTRMQLDRVNASIASFDSLYLRELQKRKLVAPSANIVDREERILGGFVMDPKPGIYDNIVIVDFKSLYPSIIRSFNIDPVSFVPKENAKLFKSSELLEAPNGALFKRKDGVLPDVIQHMWEQRDKAKKRKEKLAIYAIKILMNCFTPDTDILTDQGIKKITEIKKGDLVYSLNPKTRKTELNKVTRTFKYPYKGKVISIQSKNVDFIVTPNHRFFVKVGKKYQWFEAQELLEKATKNFWLPKHKSIKGKIIKWFDLKKKCNELAIAFRIKEEKLQKARKHSSVPNRYHLSDWLQLIGWYVSEGYIYISKEKRYPGKVSWRGVSHKIILCQKKEKTREKIIKLLKKMGLKYSSEFNGITVTNQILAEVLLAECGAGSHNKRIPNWVFELDQSILHNLFKTAMLGDGNSNGERYSSKNKDLAEDVLRLVHHLGYYGFVYEDTQKYDGEDYTMYRVQINKRKGIRPYISKYKNIREVDYEGSVYCVEVSPNHTVLAGRNTKLHFCGQSFFGVMANPTFRFHSLEMANAITHFGQLIIKKCAEEIEKKGFEVIYGDTDSLFVNVNAKDYKNALKVGKTIETEINSFFKSFVKKEYKKESFLELEFEKVYKKLFLPKARKSAEGAKKRYSGLLEKDKKDVLEFTGLEFVRRDWTEAARKFQYDLHWKVFHNKNPSKFIKEFVADLKKGKFDELLIYKKGIRKSVDSYTKTTPPHIKAARKAGIKKVGILEYVMTLDGPEAVGFQKSKMDYEHYVEKQIKPIAEAVLIFFDLTFDDVLKASKQVSLGDF